MTVTKEKLICMNCTKEKIKQYNFYNTKNKMYKNIGKIPVCKECLKSMVDYENMETIYSILRQFDIMFDIQFWQTAEQSKTDTFAKYITMANSLPQFEGAGWNDSVFNIEENKNNKDTSTDNDKNDIEVIDKSLLNELKEKYGHGYPDEEYILFEKKFIKLKPSFQLPTTMHEEYLREYCVNKVKETIAKSKGDFKEAKEWSTMAKESAEAGKLKPSQMSKADLSQGLDGFGQLSRMVEQHRDIIPLLPKFTRQPKDDVDVTLWLYVNYVRDLQGLEPAEYKELYKFYDERAKDYDTEKLDDSEEMQVTEEDVEL